MSGTVGNFRTEYSNFFAVRKCASVSDRTEEKNFFLEIFSNDIFILSRRKFYIFVLRKMGDKHMMIKSRLS